MGLLWKRTIKQNNDEVFEYICKADETKNNAADSFFFWWAQYISFGCWVIFLILKTFTAQFFVVLIPAVLNGFNLYAYFMCSRDKQAQVNSYVDSKKQEATGFALNHALEQQGLGGGAQR